MLRIKLYRSIIGQTPRNRATAAALGLKRPNNVVEKADTPSIRGMIHAIRHMVVVEEVATGKIIIDARKIKRRALTRDHKPPETH
ncbi:MAG: 50S ribosomal protein L30 [Fimbriimonadaceae bacterium]|nr:50S ribosomal protein L30 [Fimbriimonadaceae bacterium]